ncbi:MAG TPA: ABC transporter ATP-binding protein [Chloroflexia bacterium]|nr:ABC transporter ATP-binding protein [Chloroflexia bacterium]
MAAIELVNVSKRYGRHQAIQELNLKVEKGEMFGFLGPNGAGKTTTIRLLLGLLKPESGQVHLFGYPVGPETLFLRGRLGYLPDIAKIDGGFRGEEWLDYLAALQPENYNPDYRKYLCEQLDLPASVRERRIKTYSRGTRQKLAIIQALQHQPDLIIMDEPTEGLDPLAKRSLFKLLQEAQAQGATIFFSSHILSEVEKLCDRVALIRAGKLVALDSIAALRDRQARRIELQFENEKAVTPALREQLENVAAQGNGELQVEGLRWRMTLKGNLTPLLKALAAHSIKDIVIEPADLEEIFLSYY